VINKDDNRRQILILSNLLNLCGIDCIIDQYYRTDGSIINWSDWVSTQMDSCISGGGYILLECSQNMYDLLERNSGNCRIEMADGHIFSQSFKYYLQHNVKSFLPFKIDDDSSSCIPHSLSERTLYHFPFSKLPQKFTCESGDSSCNLTPDDVVQLLDNPNFDSLRNLVATLTKQQEIPKPNLCQTSKKSNLLLYIACLCIFICTYIGNCITG